MLLSIPLLAFISATVSHELRQEIAFLGALGVTRAFIRQLMIAESFTCSVIGCVIGIGSAAIVLISFQNFIDFFLEIPFSIAPSATLIAAAASICFFVLR